MAQVALHPQLLLDAHLIGSLPKCRVLLHRNAVVPWFILVPDTTVLDLLDLPSDELADIMNEAAFISLFVKARLGCTKVNFASIGNIVPQLHLHIVGRRISDPCWPAPVWGNLRETREYSAAELGELVQALVSHAPDRFAVR